MARLKGSVQKCKPVKGRKKHVDYSEEMNTNFDEFIEDGYILCELN
jgi:hypothetical protein